MKDGFLPMTAAQQRALNAIPGSAEAEIWETVASWRADGRRFILASVVASRGFTPRKAGAHMLIAEDGATAGTVGGGAIEHVVREEARKLLLGGETHLLQKHLTTELGLCCGGEMSVFLEVVEPAPRLFVFGGGYIGQALAGMACACGFRVTVIDARAEWAHSERFPGARLCVEEPESFLRREPPGASDFAVVVTHDHGLDQRIVERLLPQPLRFHGMVGSVPKQRKFALRLKARGFDAEQIARLRSPLGLRIGAATPQEIAISIMAELVQVRRAAAPARLTQ